MDAYNQRLKKEREEAAVKRARLAGIMSALGFTPDKETGEEGSRAYVRGLRADGARCAMEQDTYKMGGRIGFTAWTPSPEDGTSVKTPDQITMAATKTDDQIIKDVQKRYIPAFEPCMVEYRAKFDKARRAEECQDALISGCAGLLGYKISDRTRTCEKPRLYEYPEGEHVKKVIVETNYYGTEARIELSLSPEAAMLICSKLGEWMKKGGA